MFVGCALVLATVAAAARVAPRDIWRRARFILPVVLFVAVFLPFVRKGGQAYEIGPLTAYQGGLEVFGAVAMKATIGTISAVLLGATTTFPAVLRGSRPCVCRSCWC